MRREATIRSTSALVLISILVASITALPANAATVTSVNDQASKIVGLRIGSSPLLYNVTFTAPYVSSFASTYPSGLPTLPDTASNIIGAIATALNAANVHYAGPAPYGFATFGIPVSVGGGAFDVAIGIQVNNGSLAYKPSDWIFGTRGPYSVTETDVTSFAVLTPDPQPQTITFPNPGIRYVGTELLGLVSASSGLPVMFTSATPATCKVTGFPTTNSVTTVNFIAPGACTLTATQAGDDFYFAATPVTQTFTILPAPASLYSATPLGQWPLGQCQGNVGICTVTIGDPVFTLGINNSGLVLGNTQLAEGGSAVSVAGNWVWDGKNQAAPVFPPFNYFPQSGYFGFGIYGPIGVADYPLITAINDGGSLAGSVIANSGIVTSYFDKYSANGAFAAIWSPTYASAPRSLVTYDPIITSSANAISNDGWVAGYSVSDSTGTEIHAAVWDGGGHQIDLGTLPGKAASQAFGINAAHAVVGSSSTTSRQVGSPTHAVIWLSPTSTGTDLGTLPGGTISSAVAISQDGWAVGTASIAGDAASHATLWRPSSFTPFDLSGSSGTTNSNATAINSSHQIVGNTAGFLGGPSQTSIAHATLWDAGSPMPLPIDLNMLITSGLPFNMVLSNASGINDSGWISVDAVDSTNGSQGPYILVPTISGNAAPSTIMNGQNSTLRVTPSGIAPFTYQWFKGTEGDTSIPIVGASAATFITPALSATTSYWVQITSANGIVEASTTITVTVTAPAPAALSAALASSSVDSAGNYIENIVFTNTGNSTANSPNLTSVSLVVVQGGKAVTIPTSTALPAVQNSLAPGATASVLLTFPHTAGSAGAAAVMRWSITYSAGSASGTLRLALP